MRNLIKQRKSEDGFTLIELLIVIVVLGILAAIVVFGVATFRGDATKSACNADAKSVEVASQAYFAKNGGYAASIAVLASDKYLQSAPLSGVTVPAAPSATQFSYNGTTGAIVRGAECT